MAPKRPHSQISASSDGSGVSHYDINASLVKDESQKMYRISEDAQRNWLRRSKTWTGLDPKLWRARKIIGGGTQGICGMWEYTGDDPDMPKHMVVKQSGISEDPGLQFESKFLRACTATGTDHIVKLYKAFHRAPGTSAENYLDGSPFILETGTYNPKFEVSRIYLEYSPGGDANHILENLRLIKIINGLVDIKRCDEEHRSNVLPEEQAWRIFNCLAKAILVLDQGTEDPEVPDPSWGDPIVHLDIKPGNVLVGARDSDEHVRQEPIRLCDFGFSLPMPETQNDEWRQEVMVRETENWFPPEQIFKDHPNRIIDTRANVWGIGAFIHAWLYGGWPVPIDETFNYNHPTLNSIKTFAPELLKTNYSEALISLVLACIAYDPDDRPTSAEIVKRTINVVAIYDKMALESNEPPDPDPLHRPYGPNVLPDGFPPISYDTEPEMSATGERDADDDYEYVGGWKMESEGTNPLLFEDGETPETIDISDYPWEPPEKPPEKPPAEVGPVGDRAMGGGDGGGEEVEEST